MLDEEALEDAQAELLRVNLLQRQETQTGPRYQVHPLVREFFAVKLTELSNAEGLQRALAKALKDIAQTIPQTREDMRTWVSNVAPHYDEALSRWEKDVDGADKASYRTGTKLLLQGFLHSVEAELRYLKQHR